MTKPATIVDFLTARYDEVESAAEGSGIIAWLTFRKPDGQMQYTAVASGHPDDHWVVDGEERTDYASARVVYDYRQVLADIAAKRAIISREPDANGWDEWTEIIGILAQPYRDHPDFDPAWS